MIRAHFVLTLSSDDRPGIVAAVAGCIASLGCNIIESAQFGDADSNRFFMRVAFAAPAGLDGAAIRAEFAPVAGSFAFDWALHDLSRRQRAIILVSQAGHCLNDLLYRTQTGRLAMDVTSVVSNHRRWERRAEHEGIPFHFLPVKADAKDSQEAQLLELIDREAADLVILARYMQILSDQACATLSGRTINIHHSFLPGFKGARPYHRAHARGVKMVGATAHYVTSDLDEGPIIAQDVSVIDHADTVEDLIAQGQDTESRVLARAVRLHLDHRVMINGNRTVVFK